MPSPFFNAIKGTTSGTPGTGAFTPNAASSGYRAWSTVPTGWIGLVRYEDGTAWELSWSYWNGTTLSRGTNQRYDSSTGSVLSLTSSATAEMCIEAGEVMSHLGDTRWGGWFANGTTTPSAVGVPAPTTTGTAAAITPSGGSFIAEQNKTQITSATTANAQAAWSVAASLAFTNSTAGRGGWEVTMRWGATVLPTGPRLIMGMVGSSFIANTGEPSALLANMAIFGKDSSDTNIQLMVNSNSGACTKTDTGISWAANGWYEGCIWTDPGSLTVNALLIRLDTGAIFFTTTSTDTPISGSSVFPQMIGSLSSTTGTAIVMQMASMHLRTGL